jgi:hypothetical protein
VVSAWRELANDKGAIEDDHARANQPAWRFAGPRIGTRRICILSKGQIEDHVFPFSCSMDTNKWRDTARSKLEEVYQPHPAYRNSLCLCAVGQIGSSGRYPTAFPAGSR